MRKRCQIFQLYRLEGYELRYEWEWSTWSGGCATDINVGTSYTLFGSRVNGEHDLGISIGVWWEVVMKTTARWTRVH